MQIELQRIECGCFECQGCCENTPGWFKPGEIEKAAALMNMPPREFFERFCMVDYWAADTRHNHTTFVMRPATRREHPGNVAALTRNVYGRCIFLTAQKRCAIHGAKPHECAVVTGCNRAGAQNMNHRPFIADMWNTDDAKAEIERVTGTPVEKSEASIVLTNEIAIDVPLEQSASEKREELRRAKLALAALAVMAALDGSD